MFELYLSYVDQINDDDPLKRELENIKAKNIMAIDVVQANYYSLLFSKETGIIIANGDKGKEGLIEKTNQEIEEIFLYKTEECKSMNVTSMMPKIFQKEHKAFIERFFKIGEKRIIDKQYRTFGKDKENCIVPLVMYLKLFPVLSDSIYFCNLLYRENLDDIIFLDNNFIIQGMSKKLIDRFILNNNSFQDIEVPFYLICKTFIDIYAGRVTVRENERDNISSKLLTKSEGFTESEIYPLNFVKKNTTIISNAAFEVKPFSENHFVLEILETEEIEFEFKIPKFLIDYVNSLNKREYNKLEVFTKSNSKNIHFISRDTNINIEIINEDTLMKDKNENSVHNSKEENAVNTENNEDDALIDKNKHDENNIAFVNRTSEEDIEFQSKIKMLKTLFETGKFVELKKEIDYLNMTDRPNDIQEIKFIVTFNKHIYGGNRLSYVIRCIDTKAEHNDTMTRDSQNMANTFLKKINRSGLEDKTSLTEIEINEMKKKENDFLKLSREDNMFAKNMNFFKEEIKNVSIVFGSKKEDPRRKSY